MRRLPPRPTRTYTLFPYPTLFRSADYFRSYTCRHFDEFISRSDPTRFTSEDLAALSCLGVELKGGAVAELLVTRADELNELLNAPDMPDTTADLRHVDKAVIADTSPLSST